MPTFILQLAQLLAGLYVLFDVVQHLNYMNKKTPIAKRGAYLVLAVGAAIVVIGAITPAVSTFDVVFVVGVAMYLAVNQRTVR